MEDLEVQEGKERVSEIHKRLEGKQPPYSFVDILGEKEACIQYGSTHSILDKKYIVAYSEDGVLYYILRYKEPYDNNIIFFEKGKKKLDFLELTK